RRSYGSSAPRRSSRWAAASSAHGTRRVSRRGGRSRCGSRRCKRRGLTYTGPMDRPVIYPPSLHSMVTSATLASYARDGYLVLPGLFDPAEAARLAAWTDEVTAWPEVPGRHMVYWEAHRHEPGRRVLNRIENFHP